MDEAFHLITRQILEINLLSRLKIITYFDDNENTTRVTTKEGFFKSLTHYTLKLKGHNLEFYEEKLKYEISLLDFNYLEINQNNAVILISSKKKKEIHFFDSTTCQEWIGYINRTYKLIEWSKR